MSRWGLQNWLLVGILIGGAFEVTKRLSFSLSPASPELNSAVNSALRPYARNFSRSDRPDAAARATRLSRDGRPQFAAVARPSRPLVIPPAFGQFETRAPRPADDNRGVPEKKTGNEEKAASQDKKKCRKKLTEEYLAAHPEEAEELAKQEAELKDGEDLPDCEDDEKVADNQEDPAPNRDEADTGDGGTNADLAPTVGGGFPIGRIPGAELAGLEEWKARLLNQPNFKETVRLIELAQAGQISDVLFYTLVELMITDSRAEIREFGVLAAGRTPSVESFHLLVDILKSEPFGSKVRSRAEGEMNVYENLPYLWVLERVMRSSTDPLAVIWATRQLEDSARRFLNAKYNRPRPGSATTAGHPFLNYYQRFVVILQELSAAKGSPQQAAQARDTLFSLQNLLRAVS